ncbi:hypothetical protein HRV97_03130 [Sphingomonas sp. HHU CXW]|uniref:Bacteriophage tail tape measure C-terminal domain-containing protein n=1 Tax=Sphingomonas hominis TaxID=2741495 RepID=A0ABX2JI79_9SPHN|nr:phage tail tape measure C-terminal domain-containing protein [Sphingomonas hominis]NTS64154.1 hypothetical protein [Sphingomonas hominis]
MAGAIIGALRVVLGLDSASFKTGAKAAESRANQLASRLHTSFGTATSASATLTGALGALGSAIAIDAMAAATQRAFDYADAIVDLADRTGATTKTIQEFRYAAQMSGSDVATADAALDKFAKSLGLAQSGSDQQVKLFRELGVTSKDFDGALRQTMDGLSKLPTVQERNATALTLFGKSASTLTVLLGQGTAAYDALASSANELGIVLRDDVLRNAGQVNDNLDRLKMIMDAQFAAAIVANADKIAMLAQIAADSFSAITRYASDEADEMTAIFAGLGSVFDPLLAGAKDAFGGIRREANYARDTIANILAGVDRVRNFFPRIQNWANGVDRKLFSSSWKADAEISDLSGGFLRNEGDARQRQEEQGRRALGRQWNRGLYGGGARGAGGALPTQGNGEAAAAAKKAESDQRRAAAEAKRAAEKAKRDRERYEQELYRASNESLAAQKDLAIEISDRAAVERERLANERAAANRQVQADDDLTQAQKQVLLGLNKQIYDQKEALLLRQQAEDEAKEALTAVQARGDNEADILQAQVGLARTAKERGRLEQLILDGQFKQLRLTQQAIIDSQTASQQEKDLATERLKTLGVLEGYARERANRDNAGPLQQYFDSLPRNADELNEAYERVAADGLKNLNDGLADAITGSRSLGDVFSSIADQIIADMARIAIQQMVMKPLSRLLGDTSGDGGDGFSLPGIFGGQGGGGGFFGMFKTKSPISGMGNGPTWGMPGHEGGFLPGLATGGHFKVGGRGGIDRNVLSINGIPRAMVSADERVHVNSIGNGGARQPAEFVFYADEGSTFQPRVQQISGEQGIQIQRASSRTSAVRARQSLVR